jgi:hypothetical protein
MVWATIDYGAIGAAWIWVILNGGYITIGIHFMYRRLLVSEKWLWYGKDIILPMLGAGVIMWLSKFLQPAVENRLMWLTWLLVTAFFMVASAWIASSDLTGRYKNLI